MTYTQNDLDTLKAALLTGATSVSVSGRTVTFRSQAELITLIRTIESALNAASPSPEPKLVTRLVMRFCGFRPRW